MLSTLALLVGGLAPAAARAASQCYQFTLYPDLAGPRRPITAIFNIATTPPLTNNPTRPEGGAVFDFQHASGNVATILDESTPLVSNADRKPPSPLATGPILNRSNLTPTPYDIAGYSGLNLTVSRNSRDTVQYTFRVSFGEIYDGAEDPEINVHPGVYPTFEMAIRLEVADSGTTLPTALPPIASFTGTPVVFRAIGADIPVTVWGRGFGDLAGGTGGWPVVGVSDACFLGPQPGPTAAVTAPQVVPTPQPTASCQQSSPSDATLASPGPDENSGAATSGSGAAPDEAPPPGGGSSHDQNQASSGAQLGDASTAVHVLQPDPGNDLTLQAASAVEAEAVRADDAQSITPAVVPTSGQQCSPVKLLFQDNQDNIAGTTVQVYEGEQIALSTDPPLTKDQVPTWHVSGQPNGGYNVTTDTCPTQLEYNMPSPPCSASVMPIGSTTDPTISFYWATADTYQVTLDYTLADNTAVSIGATFSVVGPTGTLLIPCSASVSPPCSTRLSEPEGDYVGIPGMTQLLSSTGTGIPDLLSCGTSRNPCALFGIQPMTPVGHSGAFSFVQILNSATDTVVTTADRQPANQQLQCSVTYPQQTPPISLPALDSIYPDIAVWPPPPSAPGLASDTPTLPLVQLNVPPLESHDTVREWTTYLLWNPMMTDSVPVPVGHITWDWRAQVKLDTSGHWTQPQGAVNWDTNFIADSTYPTWTQVVIGSNEGNCN